MIPTDGCLVNDNTIIAVIITGVFGVVAGWISSFFSSRGQLVTARSGSYANQIERLENEITRLHSESERLRVRLHDAEHRIRQTEEGDERWRRDNYRRERGLVDLLRHTLAIIEKHDPARAERIRSEHPDLNL